MHFKIMQTSNNSMNYENYDPFFPDQPVVDQYLPVWANLPAFRAKPAFIWAKNGSKSVNQGSVLTYEQLNNSVRSISSQLLLPLQRGDTIVILCSPGLELVEIIFACQRAGLLAVPVIPPNPTFTKNDHHHLVRVLSQTKPKAVVAHFDYITRVRKYASSSSSNKKFCEMLQKVGWISTKELKDKTVNLGQNSSSYNGCKPDEVYLIQYTSGTTGIPKPVLVTAGAAAHNVRVARKAYDLHPNSVITSWLPQYHDCGLMFLLLTIVSGATIILTSPNEFINRPRLWLELITEYKATCTPVPSFTLPLVVKRGGVNEGDLPINLWSMKNLIIINEPIYKSSVDEFVQVFRPFGLNPLSIAPSYGLAENCTFVSTAWRSDDHNANNFPNYKHLLPSARLGKDDETVDIELMIVNEETHKPVDDGVEGEIWISSPSNALGYLSHPSLTCEIFQGRINDNVSQCFVKTGDRGLVIGKERFLFVTGRNSDIIKLEDSEIKDIHPHYIETAAYNSCTRFLRGGCLAAFKVSRRNIAVVAEMQRNAGEIEVLRAICERIRKVVMQEEKVEVGMVVLVKSGNVPKTTSGKIQRWLAKDKLLAGRMDVILQMKFCDIDRNSRANLERIFGESEGKTRGKGRGESAEVFVSHTNDNPTRPSFLSSL